MPNLLLISLLNGSPSLIRQLSRNWGLNLLFKMWMPQPGTLRVRWDTGWASVSVNQLWVAAISSSVPLSIVEIQPKTSSSARIEWLPAVVYHLLTNWITLMILKPKFLSQLLELTLLPLYKPPSIDSSIHSRPMTSDLGCRLPLTLSGLMVTSLVTQSKTIKVVWTSVAPSDSMYLPSMISHFWDSPQTLHSRWPSSLWLWS